MSSFLLEPILPNLTKAGNSGEQLRDLWRLFTKVKDCTQGGRRLENLYWRLWFQSSSSGVSNKEQTKLSHLLQSWTAEDAFQKPSFSSVPASPANNIQQVDENRSEQVHEPKASETTSFAFQAAQPPSAAPVAATVAPQNPELVRAPSTVSINISRVNSTIKQQAAAPACITAPVRPQQSKPIQAFLKPAKVVVGFSMDTSPKNFSNPNKPQRIPGVTSPLPKQQQQQQKQDPQPERILASVNVSSKVALKSQAQAQAQAPEQKKKFFVASSVESTSSNEHIPSYDDPPFEKMAMFSKQTPNLSQPQHPPDPGRAPAASPFSRVEPMGSEERPSNLSTLIRAPKPISRMPGRLANFAPAAGHFYRSRIDTFEPQAPQFESESLRQGVQLDHKPLFNYHLGNDPLGANFGESPNVW